MSLDWSSIGITVMAYSRPSHVSHVFNALRELRVEGFSVFMDGADDHHIRSSQEQIVRQVHAIDWADVTLIRRSINMGLRRSIVSAVTDQLERYEKVILLEDDCVPETGFFEFVGQCLDAFECRPEVRSICGYQFPTVEADESVIRPVLSTRFVPWGWATWRDRWRDYDTDLPHLVSLVEQAGIYPSLPLDVRRYLAQWKQTSDGDIWSINWVLQHYVSGSFCVYPSRSLVKNIGFDGTGVHCYQTDAFAADDTSRESCWPVVVDPDVCYDHDTDARIVSYMEDNWNATMKPHRIATTEESAAMGVRRWVTEALESTVITDFHTHLTPGPDGSINLSGPDELLRYHYLAVEALSTTRCEPRAYASMSPYEQAQFVWDALFRDRTPMSEASLGVLTILDHFGVRAGRRDYSEIRSDLINTGYTASDVLAASRVHRLVMTNDPFDPEDWSIFGLPEWDRSVFLASMRIDRLLADPAIRRRFFRDTASKGVGRKLDSQKLFDFLDASASQSESVYTSWTASGAQLEEALSDPVLTEGVLPWLGQHGMPLVLMLGVRRKVNPELGLGGDAVGTNGLDALEQLVRSHPHQIFLVTHLRDDAQHRLTVLARKFQNLKLLGFWWFMNQTSLIRRNLEMRFDLLGLDFVAHHSDARVLEQLIYKWSHFKSILGEVLSNRYRQRIQAGWPIQREEVVRDIDMLMSGNAVGYAGTFTSRLAEGK